MTTNETPRTDALADYWLEPGMAAEREIVPASFARELERELAESRKQLADWQLLESLAQQQLAAERALSAQYAQEREHNAMTALAERALADRLAGAIEAHKTQFPDEALNGELELWSHLAAWKEASREAQ